MKRENCYYNVPYALVSTIIGMILSTSIYAFFLEGTENSPYYMLLGLFVPLGFFAFGLLKAEKLESDNVFVSFGYFVLNLLSGLFVMVIMIFVYLAVGVIAI